MPDNIIPLFPAQSTPKADLDFYDAEPVNEIERALTQITADLELVLSEATLDEVSTVKLRRLIKVAHEAKDMIWFIPSVASE